MLTDQQSTAQADQCVHKGDLSPVCSRSLSHRSSAAGKVLPAFLAVLKSSSEELEGKKKALLETLQPINDYLAAEGKVSCANHAQRGMVCKGAVVAAPKRCSSGLTDTKLCVVDSDQP